MRLERLVEFLGITRALHGRVSMGATAALVLKVRDGGRIVNVHAMVATGLNIFGHREVQASTLVGFFP